MKMRRRPLRGESYVLSGGESVTIIEECSDDPESMKVIMPSGRTGIVMKSLLNLPVIDTKDYEKLRFIEKGGA